MNKDGRPDAASLPSLAYEWVRIIGGPLDDEAFDVAVDERSGVYVVGRFQGAADLGKGPVTSKGSWDSFVVAVDAQNTYRWHRAFGAADEQSALAVASGAGSLVVGGTFENAIDLGGGPVASAGFFDVYLAWLVPGTGSTIRTLRVGGAGGEYCGALTLNPAGGVVLGGYFTGVTTLCGKQIPSAGGSDLYVVGLDATGSCQWMHSAASANEDTAFRGTADAAGNVYIAGWFSGTVDLAGTKLTSVGGRDGLVASFTPAGALRWAWRFGGPTDDIAAAVAVGQGGVAVAGYITATADVGGQKLASNGGQDILIASLDPAGAPVWARNVGGPLDDQGRGAAMDRAGNVVATGCLTGKATIDGKVLSGAGKCDALVARFDPKGAHLWSRLYGGTENDWGYALAVGPGDELYVAGMFQLSADLGGGTVQGRGRADGFLLKLVPSP